MGYCCKNVNILGVFMSRLGAISLLGLFILLGISVGADIGVLKNIKSLGVRALLISAASILGSIAVTNLLGNVLRKGGMNK